MGYVALSRVRSLDGLYLNGINAMAVRLHPAIYDLDRLLKSLSAELAAITPDAEPEDEEEIEKLMDKQLLDNLKTWRAERSKAENMPAYIIGHDSLLEAIATRKPQSESQLLAINGMGPAKLAKYGPEILRITNAK
jgi:ATP-dependent DNA helicase PIF1